MVEDEFGGLEFMQGELHSILPKPAVIDKIFADQLDPFVGKLYENLQLAVWEKGTGLGQKMELGLGWSVEFIPIYVHGAKYTVTLFTPSLMF